LAHYFLERLFYSQQVKSNKHTQTRETPKVLTKLKKQIQEMLGSEANIAHKLGLTPNKISVIGFILSLAAAAAYALVPNMPVAFLVGSVVLLLASGFCDTMDGIVARTFNQASTFGAFFDSVLDRYADAAVYAGIIISGWCNPAWGLAALAGSVLVSYTRARAEGVGLKMESVGIAERAERMLILAVFTIIAIFYPPALNYGIIILAVLANFTVLQRMYHVYKKLKK
jgi:archaetidylinositol phosphate synthase